jgi:mRNA-degrading endonuclease RelE of RelBE toxin-antitoxin system
LKNKNWDINFPESFDKKHFRVLPLSVQKKIRSITEEMIYCDDPRVFGEWKGTKYGPAFVADFNDSYRLAYRVEFDIRTIRIIRAGDHKEVYGKG